MWGRAPGRWGGIAALMVTSMVIAAAGPTLIVRDETAGRDVICLPLSSTSQVAYSFTHSMYGGDVTEEFVLAGTDRLRRTSFSTANEAAAEYYAYETNVVPIDGRFVVDVPIVEFSEIVVRVDTIGAHRLRLNDSTIDLLAATGDRHQVRLTVEPTTVGQRLLSDAC